MKVRLAKNVDGPVIQSFIEKDNGGTDLSWMDWSSIEPYWIVVELAGEIVGIVQVCYGKPIGRIEMLVLSDVLTKEQKKEATSILGSSACGALQSMGSTAATAFVADEGFVEGMIQRGWVKQEVGTLLMGRLGCLNS